MNAAVVTRAAAGLGGYLADAGHAGGGVVIGYDARRRSDEFAHITAAVLAGAGFAVQVLPRALPTPVLSFAVRHLGCAAGVMVTASHNPPDDNGYKVYLGDGAQLVPPADRLIEAAIAAVGPAREVPLSDDWLTLGDDVEADYVAAVVAALEPERVPARGDADRRLHRDARRRRRRRRGRCSPPPGWPSRCSVPEQDAPDPAFPTVAFPNPEEPGATDLLKALAARDRCRRRDRRGPGRRPVLGGLRRPAADRRRGRRAARRLAAAPRGAGHVRVVAGQRLADARHRGGGGPAVGGDADRLQVDHPGRLGRGAAGVRVRGGARATRSRRPSRGTRTASPRRWPWRCWPPS